MVLLLAAGWAELCLTMLGHCPYRLLESSDLNCSNSGSTTVSD
jgi:hypothetical protein